MFDNLESLHIATSGSK